MKTNSHTIPININPAHSRGAVRTITERWSASCRIGALAASLVLAALRAHASAGTLVSWGDDTEGEVSGAPTNGTFSAVSAGGIHSVGLRTNGTLVSWGVDASLVSGTPTNGTFSAVSAGFVHSVALRTDGTLVSWGYDWYGQVSGTPTNGTFSAVSAGAYHTVALRPNGTLVSWGYDFDGEVSGTPTNGTFSAVSAGGAHSLAIKTPECGTPVVTITGPAGGSVYPANIPVTFTGTFDNANGPHTAQWIIDGNAMSTTVYESAHTVSNMFTFTGPGVYAVQLKVTNNCGNSATAETMGDLPATVVIYDPSAGFVTGAGWINSPPGAYALDEALSGKAYYAFVSKYKKGVTTPTGETDFQFKVANLKFASQSYDWLVVSGARAQYKGVGTINGAGSYGFILTAIDGQLNGSGDRTDKFRIKIWDAVGIVYDNQMGALDGADPTTVIGGGTIVIHK